MPIDPEIWREVFSLEAMPLCTEGMELAELFLASCGNAVETIDARDNRADFMSRWEDVVSHAASCPDCQEL